MPNALATHPYCASCPPSKPSFSPFGFRSSTVDKRMASCHTFLRRRPKMRIAFRYVYPHLAKDSSVMMNTGGTRWVGGSNPLAPTTTFERRGRIPSGVRPFVFLACCPKWAEMSG